ncbi:MAG TPA: hypothetical protein VFJ97_04480 [Dermatophilaceae bacterium]|nr:hypothetical protein [Dermatophilaceae bacterium]
MTITLALEDQLALADLGTYVARARALDADGAVRLQAAGGILAAYVCVLGGQGLLGHGTVLGLQVLRLSEPASVDAVVSLSAVADRLAREAGGRALPVPPVTVSAGWAAIAPPRGGWEPVGWLAAAQLRSAAVAGIEEVATGSPPDAGGHAVRALRQRVWGRDTPTAPPVPAGAAFGLHALGFLAGDRVQVLSAGRWTRLSTATGHVLLR